MSYAIGVGDAYRPAELTRMADFEIFISGAELALPWKMGDFNHIYERNRHEADEITLDASPIGRHVLRIGSWSGTATQLFRRVNRTATDIEKKSKAWPKTPHTLASALRRIISSLRAAGLCVTFDRQPGGNRDRIITLARISGGA